MEASAGSSIFVAACHSSFPQRPSNSAALLVGLIAMVSEALASEVTNERATLNNSSFDIFFMGFPGLFRACGLITAISRSQRPTPLAPCLNWYAFIKTVPNTTHHLNLQDTTAPTSIRQNSRRIPYPLFPSSAQPPVMIAFPRFPHRAPGYRSQCPFSQSMVIPGPTIKKARTVSGTRLSAADLRAYQAWWISFAARSPVLMAPSI